MGKEDNAKTLRAKDHARNERLAQALRENLKRRKTQTRNRGEETRLSASGGRTPGDEDSKQP
jgi:hypothetical protein